MADPSAKELIGHNSENINAPLLGSSSGGISGGRINEFEYEVVFNTQNLGFTVEPDIIHVAKNPKYSRVKRIVKVWKVKRVECTCGINAGATLKPAIVLQTIVEKLTCRIAQIYARLRRLLSWTREILLVARTSEADIAMTAQSSNLSSATTLLSELTVTVLSKVT